MPMYFLRCETCKLDGITVYAHSSKRDTLECPNGCPGRLETDWSRGGPAIERTWHGKETTSMALAFDPSDLSEVRKELPSAEFDGSGNVVYRNDRHQRKVMKELDAAASKARAEQMLEKSKKPKPERKVPRGFVEAMERFTGV